MECPFSRFADISLWGAADMTKGMTSASLKNGMTGTSQSPACGVGKSPPLRLGLSGYKAAFQ